jgi:hypothetical protein
VTDGAGLKQCPDCAERVRAEAMKCRYCGYRFDLHRNAKNQGAVASLFGAFRRSQGSETPFDLLAEWDVELAAGEAVRFWLFCQVSGHYGYLIITGHRILFIRPTARNRVSIVFEHLLSSLECVQLERRGRRLRLVGTDYGEVVKGLRSVDVEPLSAYLQSLVSSRGSD